MKQHGIKSKHLVQLIEEALRITSVVYPSTY